jgi:hypothetical protein
MVDTRAETPTDAQAPQSQAERMAAALEQVRAEAAPPEPPAADAQPERAPAAPPAAEAEAEEAAAPEPPAAEPPEVARVRALLEKRGYGSLDDLERALDSYNGNVRQAAERARQEAQAEARAASAQREAQLRQEDDQRFERDQQRARDLVEAQIRDYQLVGQSADLVRLRSEVQLERERNEREARRNTEQGQQLRQAFQQYQAYERQRALDAALADIPGRMATWAPWLEGVVGQQVGGELSEDTRGELRAHLGKPHVARLVLEALQRGQPAVEALQQDLIDRFADRERLGRRRAERQAERDDREAEDNRQEAIQTAPQLPRGGAGGAEPVDLARFRGTGDTMGAYRAMKEAGQL